MAGFAVLADGVGGHNAGEVASRIAVDTILSFFDREDSFNDPGVLLESAILAANSAILDDVTKNPKRKGMGTTCVCALILNRKLYAAHLGDSRMYLQRGRVLSRLTSDHTLIEEFKHLTVSHPDGIARSHPMAHILSRYLGSTHAIQVDHQLIGMAEGADSISLQSGDVLLLCSDGVSDLLSDDEISQILRTNSGRKRAQMLVYRALENGGHDNTSVIVIQIP